MGSSSVKRVISGINYRISLVVNEASLIDFYSSMILLK